MYNNKKHILIAGATGLIGTALVHELLSNGHQVHLLSRRDIKHPFAKAYQWNVELNSIDVQAFAGIDTIINLAGESIAGARWTRKRKLKILKSRTDSAHLLFDTLNKIEHNVQTYISASAVGIFGDRADELLDEHSKSGTGFLADCCVNWEQSAHQFESLGIRTVILRIGLVLSKHGGILPQMALATKCFLAAPLGNGNQWMPWIHIDDLVRIIVKGVENHEMNGVYVAFAPDLIINRNFTIVLAKVLKRPILPIAVPSFVLKLLLGEMSVLALMSTKVTSIRLSNNDFQFTNLKQAIHSIYTKDK